MEEILGVEPLEFSDADAKLDDDDAKSNEEDARLKDVFMPPLSPKSSLRSIQRQDEIKEDFAMFLESNQREDIRTVPIWIQLEDLELKYWGQKSLFKIVGQLGSPFMVDEVTKGRDKLSYPQVLIEEKEGKKQEWVVKNDTRMQEEKQTDLEAFQKVVYKVGALRLEYLGI
uniref:DUF4283 domain-containing protein n=1 Tax=Cannabis sativa TaxID=3483 RepID=A0A803QSK1_CANSA